MPVATPSLSSEIRKWFAMFQHCNACPGLRLPVFRGLAFACDVLMVVGSSFDVQLQFTSCEGSRARCLCFVVLPSGSSGLPSLHHDKGVWGRDRFSGQVSQLLFLPHCLSRSLARCMSASCIAAMSSFWGRLPGGNVTTPNAGGAATSGQGHSWGLETS